MNFNLQIKLTKIKGARLQYVDGVECVVIPVNDRVGTVVGTYVDSRNVVHSLEDICLNLEAFELRPEKQQYSTHILKPSFSKEVFENMSEEVQRRIPIVGNMSSWGFIKKNKK